MRHSALVRPFVVVVVQIPAPVPWDTTEAGRKASDLTGHRTESVVSKVYDRRRIRKAPAAR